tara:strand:+ start:5233 stop:5670 length:438 start_codon:yes stop_codon:yes gene_type:complete
MALMTNSYVRRDSNTEIGFLPPTSSEVMMMADGSAMPATAFREDYPVTKYTPEELGMNPRASPFYDPETTSAANAVPPQPSGSEVVAIDNSAAAPQVLGADTDIASTLTGGLSGFNTWASQNVGLLILGLGVLYGVYRLGGRNAS